MARVRIGGRVLAATGSPSGTIADPTLEPATLTGTIDTGAGFADALIIARSVP